MASPVVAGRDLTKRYGAGDAAVDALRGVSLDIAPTELARLDDTALTRLRRDKVGFVFQAFNLVPVLTAEENVRLPLTLAGRKPEREWHDKLIAPVGPGDRPTHPPSELSGG